MTEHGVPLHRPSLELKFNRLRALERRCFDLCKSRGLLLANTDDEKGTNKSKQDFILSLIKATPVPADTLNHPSLEKTDVLDAISFSEANVTLLTAMLPRIHPLRPIASAMLRHGHASKLLGTYLYPLLFHKRNTKKGIVRTSLLVPQQLSGDPAPWTRPLPASPVPISPPPSTPPSPSAASTDQATDPAPPAPSSSTSAPAAAGSSASAPSPSSASGTATPSTPSPPPAPSPAPTARHNPDVWLSHPSWFIVPSPFKDGGGSDGGTEQGRITCKNPAHQTDPPAIQDCIHSRWDGGLIAWADLDQIELRVPALLCGEPFFLDAYTQGHDLHSRAALRIWGQTELQLRHPALASLPVDRWKTYAPFNSRERQVGKRTNFAHLFRSGAPTMQAAVLGDIGELLPLDLFERVARSRSTELPVLWDWQERRIEEARRTGRVTLPLTGQSRAFMGGDKYEVNEIVNFPVQTTAGNTLLRIQARVHFLLRQRKIRTILPFLNVYDALKFDLRSPADLPVLRSIFQEATDWVATVDYWGILQQMFGRTVPLKFDLKHKGPFHHGPQVHRQLR